MIDIGIDGTISMFAIYVNVNIYSPLFVDPAKVITGITVVSGLG